MSERCIVGRRLSSVLQSIVRNSSDERVVPIRCHGAVSSRIEPSRMHATRQGTVINDATGDYTLVDITAVVHSSSEYLALRLELDLDSLKRLFVDAITDTDHTRRSYLGTEHSTLVATRRYPLSSSIDHHHRRSLRLSLFLLPLLILFIMHRIFGKAKPKEPAPTLDDASASVEKRGSEVDGKMKQLDEELLRYKTQLSKMRPGPAKNQVQQRAVSKQGH